jgi:phosphonate transport system substrate-binding protein
MSHSGFNAVGRDVVKSGSHIVSMEMIWNARGGIGHRYHGIGLVDRPAPELGVEIRVIETIGPSPIPPWVASTQLPGHVRSALRRTFLGMHEDSAGRDILARGRIMRFVAAHDTDYDPIRRMADVAASVSLL